MTRHTTPARPAARLAGRSEELLALRGAYRSACEGDLRLLVVDGPSAAGKSALVDAWLAEHRAGPVLRFDVRGLATGERDSLPKRVVEAALAQLSPVRRDHHAAAALLAHAARSEVVDFMVVAERRLRLREEMGRLLHEIGVPNPVVVVLEGMEDADRSSLELLEHLVEDAAPWAARPKVLVVATVEGAARGALARIARADAARTLTLRPFDRDGVRAFLASPDVVDAVLSLTGGLPELIEKLVRGEGMARDAASPEAQEALEALAVLGGRATDAALAEMLSLAGHPRLDAASLARAGAVRANGAWLLPPAARERLRATMDDKRARALHRHAADAIADHDPAAAARHALSAGHLERATELAWAGADALSAGHASVDAADLLLEVVDAHESPPPALRARLVELLWIAGAHAAAITHARVLADAAPEDAAAALRLGRLLTHAGRYDDAAAQLERARAHALEGEARTEATIALADALCSRGDYAEAERMARGVLEGEPLDSLRLEAESCLAKIELATGRLEASEERLERLLAEADAFDLPRPACAALNNLAILAMARGELSRAARQLERMTERAQEEGAVYLRGIAHKNFAVVRQLEGEWEESLRHAQRALSLLGGLGHASLVARLSFNTADLHRSLGDPYRALRLAAHAREQAEGALEPAVDAEGLRVEAAAHVELGNLEEARRAYAGALRIAERLGNAATKNEALLGLATLDLDEGDSAAARARLEAMEPAASARTLARVALLQARLGDGDEQIPLARLAVDSARETHDPLMEQTARLELALALHRSGLSGRAREELSVLRRKEGELLQRVPEPLRALFAERSLARHLAQAERRVAERPEKAAPTSDGGLMVGSSKPMRELRGWIARVGPTDSTVLITGESGTGKELVAEALHASSPREGAPFVRVNCAALVDELLSSELFGHERGAFTGADRQKKGRFELADGGTILLDEIGDISPRMQAALLRVLQERTFERVGGTKTLSVNVRVIAATHRDLKELVREGRFREDLFYRLSGITVRVPALRERLEDLPELSRHLLQKISSDIGGELKTLAPDAIEALARRDWPGNVRELENALRSVAVLSPSGLLTAADFAEHAPTRPATSPPPPSDASLGDLAYERVKDGDGSIYDLRKRIERELIERALDESGGNISRAAELLGMKRPRLSKLVHEWGLK